MKRVLDNFSCGLDPMVKLILLHFLVNTSSSKPLDVATSNFACAYVTWL